MMSRKAPLHATILLLILLFWAIAPFSVAEALFHHRLKQAALAQQDSIRLSELTHFDWEEVCEHHPYDGDFKHPESGRVYRSPFSAAHDGTWVLLCMDHKGNPESISGNCSNGGATIEEFQFRCLQREKAVLKLAQKGKCPSYAVRK